MKRILYIMIMCSCFVLNAQPPSKWFAKFGGTGIEIGYGVKETYHRQYVVVGSTSGAGAGATDAYIVLIDSMGKMLWQKTFGGVLSDVAKSVVVNPVDSGFIFTGFTNSFGNGGYDLYVVRTDKNGNLIWQRSFGGFDWDFGNDITLAPDGNVVICGNTFSMGYGKKDGYILKINSTAGTLMWQKYYGGGEDDDLVSLKFTSDGAITFSGTKTLADLSNDIWLLKTTYSGDSIMSKSITSYSTNEKCYDFIEDHHNKLIFCGALDVTAAMTGSYSSYLLKTDMNGNYISQISYTNGAHPDEKFTTICNTKNQDFICGVRKINQTNYKLNIHPLLTIDDFTYLSATTYGDVEDEEVFNVESCSDNGYILTGYTKSYGSVAEDLYVVKLDSNILGSPSVIGVMENTYVSNYFEFYYYKNKLYFDNPNSEETSVSIFNIEGKLIRDGYTNGKYFDLQAPKPGIYFAILKQGPISKKLKFISSAAND